MNDDEIARRDVFVSVAGGVATAFAFVAAMDTQLHAGDAARAAAVWIFVAGACAMPGVLPFVYAAAVVLATPAALYLLYDAHRYDFFLVLGVLLWTGAASVIAPTAALAGLLIRRVAPQWLGLVLMAGAATLVLAGRR